MPGALGTSDGYGDGGAAAGVQAAFLAMSHVGGKLLLFQQAVPNIGIGRVKQRENLSLYGTDK